MTRIIKRRARPVTGKNVYIRFDGFPEDPFASDASDELSEFGQKLINVASRIMNIHKDKCVPFYDKNTRTIVLMFHFNRAAWAPKAAEYAAMLAGATVTMKQTKNEYFARDDDNE